jgi:hypothetical protein
VTEEIDHQRVDELLAGYVLRSLSGDDAAEADWLLSEHVPDCDICRRTLSDFQELTSDLALDPLPMPPPDTLLPRLHRELEPASRRRRPMQLFVVAAGVVAFVGLAGLSVTQNMRASHSRSRLADISAALDKATAQGAKVVPVGPAKEISAPGSADGYLYGRNVPAAPSGQVYRVWIVHVDGTYGFAGELPIEDGYAYMHFVFEPANFAGIEVTQEPSDSVPGHPGPVLWQPAA